MRHLTAYNTLLVILSVFFAFPAAAQHLLNVEGATITVQPGAKMLINGGLQSSGKIDNQGMIELKGNFISLSQAGVFSADGNLSFTGTRPQLLAGFNLSLNSITVENDLVLFGDLVVGQEINMNNGNIDMNGHLLELKNGANLNGEIETFAIKGNGILRASSLLNQPYMESPGNIGITITSDSDLGNTIVEREHRVVELANGQTSCSVIYNAKQANRRGDMNAVVSLKYCDALGEIDETNLSLFRYDELEGQWKDLGGITNTLNKTVWQGNISQMSAWTMGERLENSFSATLVDLTGNVFTNRVVLDWSALGENELSHYEIERGNGLQFTYIGSVEARNLAAADYSFTDMPGESGVYFYRLRVVGNNGETIVSKVVTVELVIQTNLEVYPNPIIAGQELELNGFTGDHTITLVDLFGRQMMEQQIQENQSIQLSEELSAGVYVYSIKGHDKTILQGKLVVK